MKSQGPLTIAKNSLANLMRFAIGVLAAVVLPPFLTRRLSHDMYAAWVLILQLSAYAAIFELGLQSAIGKFVAQHHATDDHEGASSVVSTAVALLGVSAACALAAVAVLVWQVPHLFGQLTPPLVHQVRLGILLIGGATAIALPTTALASSFQGVQRYNVPMAIGGGSAFDGPRPSFACSRSVLPPARPSTCWPASPAGELSLDVSLPSSLPFTRWVVFPI